MPELPILQEDKDRMMRSILLMIKELEASAKSAQAADANMPPMPPTGVFERIGVAVGGLLVDPDDPHKREREEGQRKDRLSSAKSDYERSSAAFMTLRGDFLRNWPEYVDRFEMMGRDATKFQTVSSQVGSYVASLRTLLAEINARKAV